MVCVPPGLMTFALILITEIPDLSADKATGKKTLVVRLGQAQAMRLLIASLASGWLAFAAITVYRQPLWGWILAAISLPMLVVIGIIIKAASRLPNNSLERLGLLTALLLGYSTIGLVMIFLI